MTGLSSSGDRDPVERLAEEFLERHRNGERPQVGDYAERYPQWAARIQEVFPALLVMERLKPRTNEETDFVERVPTDLDDTPQLDRLGDYRILREIGRGGMGVVYEAVQESLGRHVALKVLPLHGRLSPVQMERFRLEARSAARLQHTHIVPIYGVGQHDGVPYYAMQCINGHGLDAVLQDLRQLREGHVVIEGANARSDEGSMAVARSLLTDRHGTTVSEAVRDGSAAAARPLDASHHGTRKTATVPVNPHSGVRLKAAKGDGSVLSNYTDAGYFRTVARVGLQVAEALAHAHQQGVLHRDIKPSNLLLDVQGNVWVTDFGLAKLEGSEGPTETGDVVGTLRYMAPERFEGWSDRRSDVYGLGMTLYELLTLYPAFQAVTRARLIDQVVHDPPPPLRRYDARIPRDLETIVLKAIDKEPGDRYASAEDLASDLKNFLANRPIVARRSSLPERSWRWCHRNPAMVALLAVSGIALLTLVGLGVALAYQWRLEAAYTDAAHQHEIAVEARAKSEENAQYAQMVLAEREWHAGNAARAEQILDGIPPDHRGWEWHYLKRVCHSTSQEITGFVSPVFCVAYSPDREHQKIVTAGQDDGLMVWDAKTQALLCKAEGLNGQVISASFSPDGKRLAAGVFGLERPGAIWVGSAETGRQACRTPGHFGVIWCVAFNHDGTLLASAGEDGTVIIWNAETGATLKTLGKDQTQGFTSVCFSRDGRYLAAATGTRNEHALENVPGDVKIWDTSTWTELEPLKGHTRSVNSVAFSPDGLWIASASSDRTVRIWEWKNRKERSTLRGHTQPAVGVAFSPDGKQLVSASEDTTLKMWDTETDETLLILHGHKGMVNSVAYSPDGKRIASVGDDMKLRIWDAEQRPLARRLGGVGRKWFTSVAFSRDGERLAAGNGDRTVTIWDRQDYHVQMVLPERTRPVWGVAFSPNGLLAAAHGDWNVAEQPSEVAVWNLATSSLASSLSSRLRVAWSVAFSPDGHLLAVGAGDPILGPGEVKVWDVSTGGVLHELGGFTKGVTGVAFSPDGEALASVANDGVVKVWDVRTGKARLTLESAQAFVLGVEFSPDGKSFATAGFGSLKIWSLATRAPLRDLRGHMTQVRKAAFHPNGKRLASAGDDGTVRIWDVDTGQEVLTLRGHRDPVLDVAFSPGGLELASASRDGTVRIWDGSNWSNGDAP